MRELSPLVRSRGNKQSHQYRELRATEQDERRTESRQQYDRGNDAGREQGAQATMPVADPAPVVAEACSPVSLT